MSGLFLRSILRSNASVVSSVTNGEFNRSLQQLSKEKLQWVLRSNVGLIARGAVPFVHQVGRRRDVVNIDKRSGSLKGLDSFVSAY